MGHWQGTMDQFPAGIPAHWGMIYGWYYPRWNFIYLYTSDRWESQERSVSFGQAPFLLDWWHKLGNVWQVTSGWLVHAHVDKKNNFHMFLGLKSVARMRLPFSVYKQFRSMVGSRGITARWKLCSEIFIASNLQCCDLGGTIRATRGYHLFPAGSMRVEAK